MFIKISEMLLELYERPTFLHPESTPPKKPWIFIGSIFFCVSNILEGMFQEPPAPVPMCTLTTWIFLRGKPRHGCIIFRMLIGILDSIRSITSTTSTLAQGLTLKAQPLGQDTHKISPKMPSRHPPNKMTLRLPYTP